VPLLVILATAGSCAGRVPQEEPRVLPADLYCDDDDDCEIVDYRMSDYCCLGGGESEPYAVSRASIERHQALQAANCADVGCPDDPLIGYRKPPFCRTQTDEWIAVCAGHLCKRRSIHLLLSPKTVGCESKI
jgi:hypothetical protein